MRGLYGSVRSLGFCVAGLRSCVVYCSPVIAGFFAILAYFVCIVLIWGALTLPVYADYRPVLYVAYSPAVVMNLPVVADGTAAAIAYMPTVEDCNSLSSQIVAANNWQEIISASTTVPTWGQCRFYRVTSGGSYGYSTVSFNTGSCAADEIAVSSGSYFSCVAESVCSGFPDEFASVVGSGSVTGFFPYSPLGSSPVSASQVCFDTGGRECVLSVSGVVEVHQYIDSSSLLGHNVTLTPSSVECDDIASTYFLQSWDSPAPLPTDSFCDDPANSGEAVCQFPDGGEMGGEELPEIVNDETLPNSPGASSPIVDSNDPDPTSITDATALSQALLDEQQDTSEAVRAGNQRLENISSQLTTNNDLLAVIANELAGNREGDYSNAVAPGDCNQPADCSGDPIQCAIFYESRRARCLAEAPTGSEIVAAVNAEVSGDTVASFLAGDVVDVSDSIQAAPIYSASCPAPVSVSLLGASVSIPFDLICSLAAMLRPFVLLLGYYLAARILYSSL